MTETTQTLGQTFGVVVGEIDDPNQCAEVNQQVLSLAFAQFIAAARRYLSYQRNNSMNFASASVIDACNARAGVMGHALHFAQLLAWGDRMWPITPVVSIDVPEHAVSADGLITLVCQNWLPQLPHILLDDDKMWELFFVAVEAFEQGHDATAQIQALAAHSNDDDRWEQYVEYYATKVAPHWRLWLRGTPNITLPRI